MRKFTLCIGILGLFAIRGTAQCNLVAGYGYVTIGDSVNFLDLSTGEDTSATFLWTFGDGDSSTLQNPGHLYASAGAYNACLTVTVNDIENCISQFCNIFTVCPLIGNYTDTAVSLLTYNFTDISTGEDSSTNFYWTIDIGDSTAYANTQNLTYTFPSAADYFVCLYLTNTDMAGCNSSFCITIDIICPVSAQFQYSQPSLYTVDFQDISAGEDSSSTFYWDFGDGTYSTGQNPVHTYSQTGYYTACLTVTNNDVGCSSQSCNYVGIFCPIETAFGDSALSTYTYVFTDQSFGEDSTSTFLWDFGDSTTSTLQNPTHTYDSLGTYYACLTVTNGDINCSSEYCGYVYVTCPALASFSEATDSSAYNYLFTDQSFGEDSSTTFLWSFGDGDSSTLQNPTHTFASVGSYNVCLTVDNPDEGCSNQYCQTVYVCPVMANFDSSALSIFTYSFTDISTGEDSSATLVWSFGDGDSSNLQNPTHTYLLQGPYYACLSVTDTDLGCSNQFCAIINVSCPALPYYIYSVDSTGYNFQFTDESSGEDASTTFLWTFGDGDSSAIQNPAHSYDSAGSYTVCLTITDVDLGCSNQYCLEIGVCPVSVRFGYTVSDIYTYSFTDSSTGEGSSPGFVWYFGDGGYSLERNPVHTYSSLDVYQVCLLVTNNTLECTSQLCSYISVSCPDSASFTYANSGLLNYHFTDASTGEDTSTTYLWNFGDSATSTAKNPSHSFAGPGNYYVCLTVTNVDENCNSSYCTTITVCPASANFTDTFIGASTFSFIDSSSGEDSTTTYLWTFGDGGSSTEKNPMHTYSMPGVDTVCLTITNNDINCYSEYCSSVFVACPDTASFTYTDSLTTVYFTDASVGEDATVSYLWDFGDGTTSSLRDPIHMYDTARSYTVCLQIEDVDIGCVSEYCTTVTLSCPDSAMFTYTDTGSDYHFTDVSTSENSHATFTWAFGDGDSSALQNPEYLFPLAGTYSVCFTVHDPLYACSNTTCVPVTVSCTTAADFEYADSTNGVVLFEDNSDGEDSTTVFTWIFGDGDSSNLENPVHQYSASGTYYVCLIIYNRDLVCPDEYCDSVPVVVSGIADLNRQVPQVKLYPNPTSGLVNIETNGAMAHEIKVYNELGEEVLQLIPSQAKIIPLDVHGLVPGIYMVQVNTDFGVANVRLVVAY